MTRAPELSRLQVAVAGDLIADHYLYAQPRRLSREAPVMVLRHVSERFGAGGAANVARNLRSLGASVRLVGVVGRDAAGRELLRSLEEEGIDVAGVVARPGVATPTKTRVLAAEPRRSLQQVLRIDKEPEAPVDGELRAEVADRAAAAGREADALVVSDYEYGLVGPELGAAAAHLERAGKVVVLDPRRELEGFPRVTALTPNVEELARLARVEPERLDDARGLRAAAGALLARGTMRWLLVTRGNLGMALFGEGLSDEGVAVEASGSGEVTDVCGAGDTAAAVFALALAAGEAPERAMVLANAASGVVVMEHGAAVCSPAQLAEALAAAPPAVRLAGGRA
jgi:rfaE bifunctional protein kinase chain/domain